ncbi:MAG: beta-phosphoglucomutase [Gaiellaceae bacterium]|nr:beta-phosphoglucomutase [Gaiellaceae bacterium]
MASHAVLFDFNGTLSDDERIMCEIFQALFAEKGKPLTEQKYFGELVGLSDVEVVRAWLGEDDPVLLGEKIARYRERVADGSTVTEGAREAVRVAADRAIVAVVSGAARSEIEPVLEAAGIAGLIATMVTAEDVTNGKPDPEGYLLALDRLGVEAGGAVAFEDSEPGLDAARAAGIHCVAVLGTLPRERLARADAIVQRLDADAVRAALAASPG